MIKIELDLIAATMAAVVLLVVGHQLAGAVLLAGALVASRLRERR